MIKKVLIAEDHESANISLQKTLEELSISNTDYSYYCDEALLKITKAVEDNNSYDLLVTDLYFEKDHHPQKIEGGAQLILACRAIQPDLRVLVFSAESKEAVIKTLFSVQEIDGYVRKARHDAKELKKAITAISANQSYYPPSMAKERIAENAYQFSDFDITIISLLAKGYLQKEIPAYLQKHRIKPAGLSSLEKRLNLMKESLHFTSNEQLIAFCKDYGII